MKSLKKTNEEKEQIIAEYLAGGITFRKLAEKHRVDFRIIHSWVAQYKNYDKSKMQKKVTTPSIKKNEELPTDIKQLQRELNKAKLHIELLNTMIDIAEDQLKIDIRKKSGTKQ
jgi:transposase